MNYIKHLTGFFEKVSMDFDLNPTHISLYMSIFQVWNQNRFQNPISISRDELMRISKISSTATYHKCMRELSEREYVKYMPSYNPFKGSLLEVMNLDFYTKPIQKKEIKKIKIRQKNNQVTNHANDQLSDQVNDQVNDQASDQVLNRHQTSSKLLPYINSINNINFVNGQKQKIQNDSENILNKNDIHSDHSALSQSEKPKKKLREKKGTTTLEDISSSGVTNKKIPPDWENVLQFFKEKNATELDAQKFYNHFQSNGWLVGGKSKMKDWQAAARNWLLNTDKFGLKTKNNTQVPFAGNLHVKTDKNYEEPL